MIKRGDLYFADLTPVVGSEQGGNRPVLIIQNNVGNKYSPTVIVAALTTKLQKAKMPTHIFVPSAVSGLKRDSIILLEQIRTIDKIRLGAKIGEVESKTLEEVDQALKVSLGVNKWNTAK